MLVDPHEGGRARPGSLTCLPPQEAPGQPQPWAPPWRWRCSSAAGRRPRPRPGPSLSVKHWVGGSGRAESWDATEGSSQGGSCAGPGHCLPQHCRGLCHGPQWKGGPSYTDPELALRPCHETPQGEQAQGPDSFYGSGLGYFKQLYNMRDLWKCCSEVIYLRNLQVSPLMLSSSLFPFLLHDHACLSVADQPCFFILKISVCCSRSRSAESKATGSWEPKLLAANISVSGTGISSLTCSGLIWDVSDMLHGAVLRKCVWPALWGSACRKPLLAGWQTPSSCANYFHFELRV